MTKKIKNSNFSLFFKANLLLSMLIFLLFLQYNNNYHVADFLLVFLGAISTATLVYLVLYALLFFSKFMGSLGLYLLAVVFTLVNISLLVDFFIFKLFKFHINGMVVNILTSPDAMDSIQAGITPVIAFFVVIIVLFLFELYLIKKIIKTDDTYKVTLNSRLNKLIIAPLFVIFVGEKVAYGFSSLFSKSETLTKFQVIPLYQPLTFSRTAAKYFDIKPKVQAKNTIQINANLNYPLKPLVMVDRPNKINIFIFGVDSVKSTVVSPQTTPRLEAFKKDSLVLKNHYSGGNTTRFGIFSLLYGLNASYWFPFLNANKGTLLFDVLKKLNYQINITSSTTTNWPEFKNTCYVQIQESIKDDFEGLPWKKDEQASAYFKGWLGKQDYSKPLFSFVFFDAPHGYSFPREVNPFGAKEEVANYLTLKANSDEIKAVEQQYKSAVFYDDKLFGEMLDSLKEKGVYEDSLIIYTSDHGQEFFEFGDFGHNTNFSTAQTRVPMVIKLPKFLMDQIELPEGTKDMSLEMLSSHIDIMPSILSLIGVKNKVTDYSNGKNIFDKNYRRNQVTSTNWTKNSIISDDKTQIFSNTPDKIFSSEVRDSKTYKLIKNAAVDSKKIIQVIKENQRFLK